MPRFATLAAAFLFTWMQSRVEADQVIVRIPKADASQSTAEVVVAGATTAAPTPDDDTVSVQTFDVLSTSNFCVSVNGFDITISTSNLPATCRSWASSSTDGIDVQDCFNIAIASGESASAVAGNDSTATATSSTVSCNNIALADGTRAAAIARGTSSNQATARGEDSSAMIATVSEMDGTTDTTTGSVNVVQNVATAIGTRAKARIETDSALTDAIDTNAALTTSNNQALSVGDDGVATVRAYSQSCMAEAGRNDTSDIGNSATVESGLVGAVARAMFGTYNTALVTASGSEAVAGGNGIMNDDGLGSNNNATATAVQATARAGQAGDNHIAVASAPNAVAQAGFGIGNNQAYALGNNSWAQAWEGQGNTATATRFQSLSIVMNGEYNNVTANAAFAYATASNGSRNVVNADGRLSYALVTGGNDHIVTSSGEESIGQCQGGERNRVTSSAARSYAVVVDGADNAATASANQASASIVKSASFNSVTASGADCTVAVVDNGDGSQAQTC